MTQWYMDKRGARQYCDSPRLSNEYIAWPAIKNLCGDVAGKRILDLGTAKGETAQKLVSMGANCLGIDISPEMLRIAHEVANEKARIDWLERDCSNLEGVLDGEFDITIMNFLLCDIPSLEKIRMIFQEAHRVTKNHGKAIFTMHHPLQLNLKTPLRDNGLVANSELSSYFASGEEVKRFLKTCDGVATVDNFHWTIEDYVDSFTGAGFLIDAIKEPRPVSPPSEFARNFEQAYSTPLYLVVRGTKNES